MIRLREGEKITKAFEVKQSFHGRGIFYVTNLGVYLETQRNGLVLDLPFETIRTFKDTAKDSFRIEWELGCRRAYYEFKIYGFSKELFETYFHSNKEYSQLASETDVLKKQYDPLGKIRGL